MNAAIQMISPPIAVLLWIFFMDIFHETHPLELWIPIIYS